MTTSATPAGWVNLPLDLLQMGIQRRYLEEFAGLHVRARDDGSCDVITRERYRKAGPPRLKTILVARGDEFYDAGAQVVMGLPPLASFTSLTQLSALRAIRRQWVASQTAPEPLWAQFVGEVQLADEAEIIPRLRAIQSNGGPDDSIWIVSGDPLLSHRLAVMRALFAARHAREAWQATPSFEGFPASRALMLDMTAAFNLCLTPPLLYRSPWAWGISAPRSTATLYRLLATPGPGRASGWGSPLDFQTGRLFQGPGFPDPPWEATERLADREAFLTWWVERVSAMLLVLADPASFGHNGIYQPERHFGTVLTIQRLFVCAVECMRLRAQNEFLRKLLFFDVLDLLAGQHLGTYEQNLHYDKQLEAWRQLQLAIPSEVLRCVRPLIDGGFEALSKVDASLWARSRRHGDRVAIDKKQGGGVELLTINRVRADYLRILRDSHHGFAKLLENQRDLSFLASFTGELSVRLPDLVWWYLVRLLVDPGQLVKLV